MCIDGRSGSMFDRQSDWREMKVAWFYRAIVALQHSGLLEGLVYLFF